MLILQPRNITIFYPERTILCYVADRQRERYPMLEPSSVFYMPQARAKHVGLWLHSVRKWETVSGLLQCLQSPYWCFPIWCTGRIQDLERGVRSLVDPGIKFGRGTWRARGREPITAVWGQSPQRSPGADPLVGVSGAKPPCSWKPFSFWTSSEIDKIASVYRGFLPALELTTLKLNTPSTDWSNPEADITAGTHHIIIISQHYSGRSQSLQVTETSDRENPRHPFLQIAPWSS